MKLKNLLYVFFFLSVLGMGVTSCSNEDDFGREDWKFEPIEFSIRVMRDGADLLDPRTEGTMANNKITVTYKGVKYENVNAYEFNEDGIPVNKEKASRACEATFDGLKTTVNSNQQFFLYFGEIDSDETFENEKILIDWGDGTTDEIVFSCKQWWDEEDIPQWEYSFSLSGVESSKSDRKSPYWKIEK